eukprot:GDKK01047981.1.p1 GENE.GDKK01047981.1~~GDKK01047981.1.p1  ORF type:complete len:161 (-),score=15.12 GDKK01047981.1:2083-2541(-)
MSVESSIAISMSPAPSTPIRKSKLNSNENNSFCLWSELGIKPIAEKSPPRLCDESCFSPEPCTPKRFNFVSFGNHPFAPVASSHDLKPVRSTSLDICDLSTTIPTNCFGNMTADMTFSTPPRQSGSVARTSFTYREDGETIANLPRFPTLSF